jgi:hypothetical protein
MPPAGPRRERILLQRLDTITGEYQNLPLGAWEWAARSSTGAGRYTYRIAYRRDLNSFTHTAPAMRIRDGDRILDVEDVAETVPYDEVTLTGQSRQIETEELKSGARRTQRWPKT